MQRFRNGQRVKVLAAMAAVGATAGNRADIAPALGTVVRLRNCDDGAWVRLDERAAAEVHGFPADDSRANNVLTYPDWCEVPHA